MTEAQILKLPDEDTEINIDFTPVFIKGSYHISHADIVVKNFHDVDMTQHILAEQRTEGSRLRIRLTGGFISGSPYQIEVYAMIVTPSGETLVNRESFMMIVTGDVDAVRRLQSRPLIDVLDTSDEEDIDFMDIEKEFCDPLPAARERGIRVIRIDRNRRTRT